MKCRLIMIVLLACSGAWISSSAQAVEPTPQTTPMAGKMTVTVDNFIRAESDLYFSNIAKDGGFGKFVHRREPASVENQSVIRLNRDTLYSAVVFDLDAAPATVTLPKSSSRFMSLMVINEDHYVPLVAYGEGKYTFTKEDFGTRYVLVAIRTLVDPSDPEDVREVHRLQNAMEIEQAHLGTLDLPKWDLVSQKKVRDSLLSLATTMPDFRRCFGSKQQVDPIRHFIASAAGWGGNPDKDAVYLNFTPPKNDGKTVYKLTVKDVPVDGFWSISLYNAEGYFLKNDANAYSVNNITSKKNADGSVTIQFGGDGKSTPNTLPIMTGWNYTVRLYRPRKEILDGTWKFPEPVELR